MWVNIVSRCTNEKDAAYKDYGARGINVNATWQENFKEFANYLENTLGSCPSKRHTLDRINNNLGYVPGNLRWATWEVQAKNRRSVRSLSNYSNEEILEEIKRRQLCFKPPILQTMP